MEKQSSGVTSTGASTPSHGHIPHIHRPRLKHFLHPNGKRIHVANSPEEAERLRRAFTNENKRRETLQALGDGDEGWAAVVDDNDEFDLVIHGSPEHVDALRETHEHHSSKWNVLKEKHVELAAEFEDIYRQMDHLSDELHHITEHAVQLDANFSKYGYSATIRTRDSPSDSRAPSISGASSEHHDWKSEKDRGIPMKLYQTPIIRQYFHKGLLWRATESQEVASYELFVDLLYVGIIAIAGDAASESPSGITLLRFIITFTLGWKFWLEVTNFIGWFDADDITRRLLVLFDLVLLLGFTTNIVESFDTTYTPMIAFYVAGRLYAGLYFAWMAQAIPMVRATMILNAVVTLVPVAFWIGSIHVPFYVNQSLIWLAIFSDMFGYICVVLLATRAVRRGKKKNPESNMWLDKLFEFTPAANIEHKIERTGSFVTLVFGYSVVALLYQSRVPFGINAFFGKAVLGLIQAFSFNWMYFEVDSFNLHTHAIRRAISSSMVWHTLHLPFLMGFTLAGAALSRLVLARDCSDSPLDSLSDIYVSRSEMEVPTALRWFYCGGLAIALACMGGLSLTHQYKHIPGQRVSRHRRLYIRFVVALVFLLLPIAGDRLSSLQLVSITTGLTGLVLILDLLGSTCIHERLFGCSRKKCGYQARCHVSKKELQANVLEGKVLAVTDLAAKGTEKGTINLA